MNGVWATFARIITAVGDPAGQCYVASEALWHALGGGKRSVWVPHVIRWPIGKGPICRSYGQRSHTHWYLQHRDGGTILDPTVAQFTSNPDYTIGRGCGFLTARPSKRAAAILERAGL